MALIQDLKLENFQARQALRDNFVQLINVSDDGTENERESWIAMSRSYSDLQLEQSHASQAKALSTSPSSKSTKCAQA